MLAGKRMRGYLTQGWGWGEGSAGFQPACILEPGRKERRETIMGEKQGANLYC